MDFKISIKSVKKIASIENLFFALALLFGLMMSFIGTPFQECDGWDHFLRAVDVSYGNVLSPVATLNHSGGKLEIPENFSEINYHITEPGSGEGSAYKSYLKSFAPSKKSTTINFNGGIMSVFYYPQAVGFLLGRLFGASVFGCVVLGRIFNLLAFLILAYIGIRISPVLKNSMIAIALFPMTIYQAASFSPDALLNGLCFLFTGLCFYYAFGKKEKLGIKEPLTLGIILSFIFLCKYVYVFLGLLVFLIPKEKFGDNREYFKKFMIALIPILLLGIIAVKTAIGVVSGGAEKVVSAESATAVSSMTPLQFLLASPVNVLKVLFYTFCYKLSDYILWLDVLGSLNYPLGPLIYIVPMFTLYVIGSEVTEKPDMIKIKHKLLALLCFILVSLGVVLGIYIGDTRINHAGELLVQGVQGRYFIAVLPVAALVLAPRKRTGKEKYFDYILLIVEFFILALSIYFLRGSCY